MIKKQVDRKFHKRYISLSQYYYFLYKYCYLYFCSNIIEPRDFYRMRFDARRRLFSSDKIYDLRPQSILHIFFRQYKDKNTIIKNAL